MSLLENFKKSQDKKPPHGKTITTVKDSDIDDTSSSDNDDNQAATIAAADSKHSYSCNYSNGDKKGDTSDGDVWEGE
jgi:hypothetical protein